MKQKDGIEKAIWYRETEDDYAAAALIDACHEAIKDNSARRTVARRNAGAYEGNCLTSFSWNGYQYQDTNVWGVTEEDPEPVRNTLWSICNTLATSLAANDDPQPQFMYNRGGWKEKVKAVRMGRMVSAENKRPHGRFQNVSQLYSHGVKVAIVTGNFSVWYHGWKSGPRAELDDTLTTGIQYSGRFGRITSIVRTTWEDADELADEFADDEEALEAIWRNELNLPDGTEAGEIYQDIACRRGVLVHQGIWCAHGKREGRKLWVLQDGTILLDRSYKHEKPPVVMWSLEPELWGRWGRAAASVIFTLCLRQDRMLKDCEQSEFNSPHNIVLRPKDSVPSAQEAEAKGWHFLDYSGPPGGYQIVSPPKFSEQTLEFSNFMGTSAHEVLGVGIQHTAAQKSLGTKSGKHEQLVASLFNERHADAERRLIHARVNGNSECMINAIKETLEQNSGYSVIWSMGNKFEKIRPADLDLDVSKYSIEIAPVSEAVDSPQARIEKADGWFDKGLLTPGEHASLLETYATQDKGAGVIQQERWLDEQIFKWQHASEEDTIEEGFYQGPDPWIDIPAALRQVALARLEARSNGAPPEVLSWFDKFLSEAAKYQAPTEPPPGAEMGTEAPILTPGMADQAAI